MTTIVGIKSEQGDPAVILASDLTRTATRWVPAGDSAYREQRKSEGQKIYVSDSNEVAICMAGIFDPPYTDFLSKILNGKIDVRKAIERNFFEELLSTNLSRWNGQIPENEISNSLLIATRFDNKPELYSCWPLGRMDKRTWTAVGSGANYALNHISQSGRLIPTYLSLEAGIELAVESVDKASEDLHTGGLDLVAIFPEGIKNYGNIIQQRLRDAKKDALAEIKQQCCSDARRK